MRGAREYAELFGAEQHGKLYLLPGSHARGRTFHIYVLPSADPITGPPYGVKDAVVVYGIVSGQPGWTESYGWLHRGQWERDFAELVDATLERKKLAAIERLNKEVAAASAARDRTKALLAAY